MIINLIYDNQSQNAPQSFKNAMTAAANLIASTLTDNITVNILVGYGEYNNGQISGITTGAVGGANASSVSYSTLRNALATHTTSVDDLGTLNALPNGSSLDGRSSFFTGFAIQKALGLRSATNSAIDGIVGIGNQIPDNLLVGVALHEITHAMGRINGEATLDFDRFTGVGTRLYSGGGTANAAYLSFDGGVTKIADFGRTSDPSDFLNSGIQGSNDPFNEFYTSSTIQSLTSVDKRQLDVLGYDSGPPPLPVDQTSLVADFNGDHRADLLRFNGSEGWVSLASSLHVGFDRATLWGTGLSTNDLPVDLNGDGRADLFLFSSGHALVSLSNGTGFGSVTDWQSGLTASDRLVDLNGDGKADLLQIYNGSVVVALSTGSSFGSWQRWANGATSSDQAFDVTGDGRADLIQFYNGRELVAVSTGSSFANWTDWATGATASDRLSDVTGDGRADLVQFYNGRELVAISTGSSFASWTDWTTGATATDRLADVNGDGRADLVQFYNGRAVVALSSGSSFGAWTDWASGISLTDKLVDLNGDGKLDLLQFYNNNAYAALSTGSSFGTWTLWASSDGSSPTGAVEEISQSDFVASGGQVSNDPDVVTLIDGEPTNDEQDEHDVAMNVNLVNNESRATALQDQDQAQDQAQLGTQKLAADGDTFRFDGSDLLLDHFNPALDHIEVAKDLAATLDAILAHATQVGPDVVITFDASDVIKLANVHLDDLHTSQFLLV